MRAYHLQPEMLFYNSVLSACENDGGQWETAQALLHEMRTHCIKLHTCFYNSVLSACENVGGHWETVQALLYEMRTHRTEAWQAILLLSA